MLLSPFNILTMLSTFAVSAWVCVLIDYIFHLFWLWVHQFLFLLDVIWMFCLWVLKSLCCCSFFFWSFSKCESTYWSDNLEIFAPFPLHFIIIIIILPKFNKSTHREIDFFLFFFALLPPFVSLSAWQNGWIYYFPFPAISYYLCLCGFNFIASNFVFVHSRPLLSATIFRFLCNVLLDFSYYFFTFSMAVAKLQRKTCLLLCIGRITEKFTFFIVSSISHFIPCHSIPLFCSHCAYYGCGSCFEFIRWFYFVWLQFCCSIFFLLPLFCHTTTTTAATNER